MDRKPKFAAIHILRTLPFSNVNRDDVGAPKTLIMNGKERARISSQALKRAARVNFEAESGADASVRTKLLADRADVMLPEIVAALEAAGAATAAVALEQQFRAAVKREIRKTTAGLVTGKVKAEDDPSKKAAAEDDPKDTVIWLAEAELRDIAQKVLVKVLEDSDIKADDILAEALADGTPSLTVAAFGRMFANKPQLQTEAAIQVGSSFCVRDEPTKQMDYFSAVDDWRLAATGGSGAAHLDTSYHTQGCFYTHMLVDREQLLRNWTDASDSDAANRLATLFVSLVTSLPSGKANSSAPGTRPALIMIELTDASMANLHEAFVVPVPASDPGVVNNAVVRLLEHKATLNQFYGDVAETFTLDVTGTYPQRSTLPELADAFAEWVLPTADEHGVAALAVQPE